MASIMVTFFFEDADGYGWSERFWYGGDPTDPALLTNVTAMANARASLLTTSAKILRIRVATGVKRNPRILIFGSMTSIPGTYAPPTSPSEVSLLVVFQNPTVGFNRTFLRGIPLEIVQADSYVPTTTWTPLFDAWLAIMEGGNWNIVGTLGGSPTRFNMSALTPTAPRGYTFVCTSPPTISPLVVGSIIRVHNTKIPGYSGLKTITQVIGATVFGVGGSSPPTPDTGSAQYLTQPGSFDQPITTAYADKLTRRGAGRPFGLTRGRRQTLYSLRQ